MLVDVYSRDLTVRKRGQIESLDTWATTEIQDAGSLREPLQHAKRLPRGLEITGPSSRNIVVHFREHCHFQFLKS